MVRDPLYDNDDHADRTSKSLRGHKMKNLKEMSNVDTLQCANPKSISQFILLCIYFTN